MDDIAHFEVCQIVVVRVPVEVVIISPQLQRDLLVINYPILIVTCLLLVVLLGDESHFLVMLVQDIEVFDLGDESLRT